MEFQLLAQIDLRSVMTAGEATGYLGITRQSLETAAAAGKLVSRKCGRTRIYSRRSVLSYEVDRSRLTQRMKELGLEARTGRLRRRRARPKKWEGMTLNAENRQIAQFTSAEEAILWYETEVSDLETERGGWTRS